MRILLVLAAAAAAEDLSQQGARAMREGRFEDAVAIYKRMLESTPDEPRLRMNLGLALYSAKKYSEAITELDRFLKADPKPGPVHFVVGVARLKLGRHCQAIPPLEKARQWQANEQVLVELGDAYQGCKRHLEAARAYQAASSLNPADGRLKRASAHALWMAREYAQALPLFRELEASFSRDPEFLYEYGDTLGRLQGAASGLRFLEQAARLAPQLLPARGALGRALLELGRHEESIPHLEAAVSADATLWMPLSRAYQRAGRPDEAARALAEYKKRLAQN